MRLWNWRFQGKAYPYTYNGSFEYNQAQRDRNVEQYLRTVELAKERDARWLRRHLNKRRREKKGRVYKS